MRRWTFTGWALAAACVVAVGLVGLILHLDSAAEEEADRLAAAKRDYEILNSLRLRYRELTARLERIPVNREPGTESWQAYLSQKASESQLPDPVIQEDPSSRGPLKERAFTVTMTAKAGSPISRRQFVQFLDRVETERPGFKSKAVTLRFAKEAPEDLSRASATFSHFD